MTTNWSILEAIIRLIAERTGLQSTLEGEVERTVPSWWSRHGRWVVTVGSGLALAVGMAFSWLGPAVGWEQAGGDRLARVAYALAVVVGGIGIFPRAARNLVRLRFDIDVLMGLAILGAMGLGQWDEAATVAFLYGLSEALEGLSLDYARRSIRALLELAPPTAERIGADGTTQVVAGEPDSAGRPCSGSRRRYDSGGRRRWPWGGRASIRRRSPASRSRCSAKRAIRSTRGRSTAKGRWKSRPSGPVGDALISRVIAQVRASQAGRAPIERRISRFAAIYTPMVIALVAVGHARPAPVGPGHGRARCGRRGRLARVVWARPRGAGHRVSVCAGDRDAGGRRLWTGGGGARRAC